MALTKTAGWSLGTAGLCVALTAASWFLLIEPERAEATEMRAQTVAAETTNSELEARIEQLKIDFAERPAREAELAAIRQALPDQPALARLVREVNGAGTDAGLTVDSIITGAAAAVVDPVAVTATEEAGAEAPAEGEEPAAEPSAEPSEPAADPGGVSEVAGAPAGSVLASVPVTIEVTGDFSTSVLFLKQVQTDIERAFLVDGFGMNAVDPVAASPGVEAVPAGTVKTSITARVFVFVDAQSVSAEAAPEGTTDPTAATP